MNWESRFCSFMKIALFGHAGAAAGKTVPAARISFAYFHRTGKISAFGESYAFFVEDVYCFVNATPCFKVHYSCSILYSFDNNRQRKAKLLVILSSERLGADVKKSRGAIAPRLSGNELFQLITDVLRQLRAVNGHKAVEQVSKIVLHHTFSFLKMNLGAVLRLFPGADLRQFGVTDGYKTVEQVFHVVFHVKLPPTF